MQITPFHLKWALIGACLGIVLALALVAYLEYFVPPLETLS